MSQWHKKKMGAAHLAAVNGMDAYSAWISRYTPEDAAILEQLRSEARIGFSSVTMPDNVVHITNLNSSGAGSLPDAILNASGDAIVFDVAGEIDIDGAASFPPLAGTRPTDFWIAGQTAPGPGITIRNGGFIFSADNFAMEHIRFRTGEKWAAGVIDDWVSEGGDLYSSSSFQWARFTNNAHIDRCFVGATELTRITDGTSPQPGEFGLNTITNQVLINSALDVLGSEVIILLNKSLMPDPCDFSTCTNGMIRNCSFAHGTDIGNLLQDLDDFDFIDNIVSEAYNYPWHPKYDPGEGSHSRGLLLKRNGNTGNNNILIDGNVFCSNSGRNPRMSDANSCTSHNLTWGSEINNIELDCRSEDEEGNVDRGFSQINIEGNVVYSNDTAMFMLVDSFGEVYFAPNNFFQDRIETDPWNSSLVHHRDDFGSEDPVPLDSQSATSLIRPDNFYNRTPEDVIYRTLIRAGARPLERDSHDLRAIASFGKRFSTPFVPDRDADFGGHPAITPVNEVAVVDTENLAADLEAKSLDLIFES